MAAVAVSIIIIIIIIIIIANICCMLLQGRDLTLTTVPHGGLHYHSRITDNVQISHPQDLCLLMQEPKSHSRGPPLTAVFTHARLPDRNAGGHADPLSAVKTDSRVLFKPLNF